MAYIEQSEAPHAAGGPEILTAQEALKLLYLTYRTVRARGRRLGFARVQFVAANAGDGTSTVARDFALVAALRARDRVLLLDLAMPPNDQLRHLGQRGLVEGPAAMPAVELGLPVEAPHEAPGGASGGGAVVHTWLKFHRVRASTLYVSERQEAAGGGEEPPGMAQFWEKMRAEFELVVVDSPALSHSFDPVMVANQMDAVVLIVNAESTRAPVARNLRDRLMEVGGPVIGCVLNRRRYHIPGFLYRRL
jgi:Mrp family chromosome partitioning ATPase